MQPKNIFFNNKIVDYIRASLARRLVVTLVVLSFLPLIIIFTATYFRSRLTIRDQTVDQLTQISDYYSNELEKTAITSHEILTNDNLVKAVREVVEDPTSEARMNTAEAELAKNKKGAFTRDDDFRHFNQLLILKPDGTILVSTTKEWTNISISSNPSLRRLISANGNFAIFNPAPLYSNELVIFSVHTLMDEQGNPLASLVGANISPLYARTLTNAGSFIRSSYAAFLTEDNVYLIYDPSLNRISPSYIPSDYLDRINRLLRSDKREGWVEYISTKNVPVLGFANWLPALNMGLIIEVPKISIYQNINFLSIFNLILLLLSFLIIGSIVYLTSLQIVRPIKELSNKARAFSEGDWTQRVNTDRVDEVGLLAHAFNHMVDQLVEMYRTLQSKVEERTKQIRISSEAAQFATSTTSREDFLQRITSLLIERFGYLYSSIALVDETGSYAVLQAEELHNELEGHTFEFQGSYSRGNLFKGARFRISPETLTGWVIENKQVRVVPEDNGNFGPDTSHSSLLEIRVPGAQLEAAIPILAGNQALGVLDVQSSSLDAFDNETIITLQTIANQIANGLKNIDRFESTQVNMDEIIHLFRASRQITHATKKNDVLHQLNTALAGTSYISGLYAVEEDHLTILGINDPKGQSVGNAIHGITIPLMDILGQIETNHPYLVDDLATSNKFSHILSFFSRRGCQAAALLPLFEEGKVTHIVVLGKRDSNKINKVAIQPYENLVEIAANTLKRLAVLDALDHSVFELQTLANVSRSISMETDPNKVYYTLHQQIIQYFGERVNLLVCIYNSQNGTIEIPYLYQDETTDIISIEPFPLGQGLASHLLREQEPLMINKNADQYTIQTGTKLIGKPAKSLLGVPLIIGGRSIGAMILQDIEKEERFTEKDLSLVMTIAPQVAITIRNVQLLTDMQKALRAYDQERFLLTTLLENIPDRIYFKDRKSRYIRVSKSFARKLGLEKPEELEGKSDSDLGSETNQSFAYRDEQQLMNNKQVEIGKIEGYVTEDGVENWFLNSRIPMITDDNEVYGILGISRDITELKQAEEQAQKTAQQLRIAAEIARDTSGTLDIDNLLSKAVNLVRERFGFYHSSIFLIDDNENAVLREATGEAGALLKASGYHIAIGSQSIVGKVTSQGEPLIVNDVYMDPNFLLNPLLPETNSELTIPLKVGNRIIGVLDVQSTHINAFSAQDINILSLLADQIAVAILNAELFHQTQFNIEKHRLVHEITTSAALGSTTDEALLATVKGLRNTMKSDRVAIFFLTERNSLEVRVSAGYEGINLSQLTCQLGEEVIGLVAKQQEPILVLDTRTDPRVINFDEIVRTQLAVPILYRGTMIGVLSVESGRIAAYNENDVEILGTLGNSLGAIIYNSQLIEEIRQQVFRQQFVFDATNRIRRSADIESTLRTSVSEIAQALGANRARIELKVESTEGNTPLNTKKNGSGSNSDHIDKEMTL